MEQKLFTLQVYTENIAGILNQITAVFTRRQINIESLNVSPSSIKGIHVLGDAAERAGAFLQPARVQRSIKF